MSHTCHWPGCEAEVPPSMWGCKKHWFSLPTRLRNAIWRTYRRGQEVTKTPSPEYLAVAKEVQEWCRQQITKQPPGAREARRLANGGKP